jgi:hypothetical protein
MKLAYLILIHNNFSQFKLLFESIYDKDFLFVVHVDKKSTEDFKKEVKDFLVIYPNVYILKSRFCNWGGFSLVDVQVRGIKKLLQTSKDWDFLINLSGSDFPVKSQKYITDFLSKHKDKNFIDARDQNSEKESLFRIRRFYFEIGRKIIETRFKRKYLKNITPYYGSQWYILNRNFCNYVIENKISKKILKFYKNTFIPDESYFQTVIMNSNFSSSVIQGNKRVIPMQNYGSPKILTLNDWEYLTNNESLFARKFDLNIDSEIIDRLLVSFKENIN